MASPGFLCAHQNRVGFVSVPPILVCGCVVTSVLGAYGWYLPSYYSFCADTARCGLVASSTGTLSWPSYAPMHADMPPPFAALFTSAPVPARHSCGPPARRCMPEAAVAKGQRPKAAVAKGQRPKAAVAKGPVAEGRCRKGPSGRRPLLRRVSGQRPPVAKGAAVGRLSRWV